ncbi:MAG TPA: gamma-glutamyl-gamma-aminobutyrate hydrolase family protein [Planctomycetota bacterium]|nr:gamma-glutamyl-gamma-aminobutyrate hydrolase family protein [Planctomycetota bacterium]
MAASARSKAPGQRPVILVSSYYFPTPTNPTRWFHTAAPMAYCDSVRLAGGCPLVAPPLDDDAEVREALARADALLLVGGPDVDPRSYGQEPHPKLQPLHPRRNDSDLRLARAAAKAGKPTLGICGGMQALNVALGGTLHQHIPDVPGLCGTDNHLLIIPDDNLHQVRVDPASRLARAMGLAQVGGGRLEVGGTSVGIASGRPQPPTSNPQPTIEVNSAHHQAVDRLGQGLRAVAWSSSDMIEAIEGPANGPFLVATQWHPERLAVTPTGEDRGGRPTAGRADQLGVFRALVEAASKAR